MDRSEIYRGMSRNRLEVATTNISATINRIADAIGIKRSKMAFFFVVFDKIKHVKGQIWIRYFNTR